MSYESPQLSPVKRKKRDDCRQAMYDHFKDYCSTTGIHGFSYLGQGRTMPENILWIILIIISIIGSIYMINEIYQKFSESPTVVTIASIRKDISSIPFPAITICPLSVLSKNSNYTRLKQKFMRHELQNADEIKQYNYASLVCQPISTVLFQGSEQYISDDIYDYLLENSPIKKIGESPLSFALRSENISLLPPLLTELGVCYSFNMPNNDDIFNNGMFNYGKEKFINSSRKLTWNYETGEYEAHGKQFPLRLMKSGFQKGLYFAIVEDIDSQDSTCSSMTGYYVLMHLPGTMPTQSSQFFIVPKGVMTTVRVKPSMIVTSTKVKTFDPAKRQCYFPSERHLKYFKLYTENNCFIECKTKILLDRCNCVFFYMPRTDSTAICGPRHVKCTTRFKQELEDDEGGEYPLNDGLKSMMKHECNCLPLCTDITYEATTSALPIDLYSTLYQSAINADNGGTELDKYNITIISFYYNSRTINTLERNEMYGISDFISNFGGLVGLFTGFSLLSGIEILYFLTLRIWGNLKIYRRWAIPSD